MTDNDIREVAKQAAREAVARQYEAVGHGASAARIRAGGHDDIAGVSDAIAVALAALEAAAPLIVGRCAEAARGVGEDARSTAFVSPNGSAKREQCLGVVGAAAVIERAILALAPKAEGEPT
jgi:hypothetical protein